MSTIEAACYSTPEEAGLRVKVIPFDRIPHQTPLFLDYLRDPVSLRRFYPSAVRFHHELADRASHVLSAYETDREALCDALWETNSLWGAGSETLANIDRLRDGKCLAVVSGQQAGLFTGPLYTIYKALSAVKLAGCLTQRGTVTVPVFWMATEDHDFAEVATAEFIRCDCCLGGVTVSSDVHPEGLPVGRAILNDSINEVLGRTFQMLPETEFTPELKSLLHKAYRPGRAYGDAFATLMTSLIGRYGLILLDPMNPRLKPLAAPLYSAAASRAQEIASSVDERSRRLVEAGYHAQVVASEDSFPLFIHDDSGARHALTRSSQGVYKAKGLSKEYTIDEITERSIREPDRFSPNVTLRAVVQDYLLPTIAYFGGAAEIAYFAQTAEVYRVLNRPPTPILHRASMTIVESRTGRTLDRYDLELTDLFHGLDALLAGVVERHLGSDTAQTFDKTEDSIKHQLDVLQDQLRLVDPTLADALETGRRKINYQLEGLRTRFHRAQLGRDQATHRQLERAFTLLYPHKTLQERTLNIISLVGRHGKYAIDWIYDAINLGSSDHQVVYL